jgi:hypothetical protein
MVSKYFPDFTVARIKYVYTVPVYTKEIMNFFYNKIKEIFWTSTPKRPVFHLDVSELHLDMSGDNSSLCCHFLGYIPS